MTPAHMSHEAIAIETAAILGWPRCESPSGFAYYDKGDGASVGVEAWRPSLSDEQALYLLRHWKRRGREASLTCLRGKNRGYLCLIDGATIHEMPHATEADTIAMAICLCSIEANQGGT